MHEREVRTQPFGLLERRRRFAGRVDRRHVLVDAEPDVRIGETEIRPRVVGIARECLAEVLDRTAERRRGPDLRGLAPAQVELVRLEVVGGTRHQWCGRMFEAQRHFQLFDNPARNLILNGKDVVEIAVVALAPQLRALACAHQLHRHANAIAGASDTPLQHRPDAECGTDRRQIGAVSP